MDLPIKKLAAGAVRLAALSQLGPIAGGIFIAGGAIATRLLAQPDWAKTSADMLMDLASDKAGELFKSAAAGFRSGRNHDVEKSMRKAALEAFEHLRGEAPEGVDDWFRDWHTYLRLRPADEIFAGISGLDPAALSYDDGDFRALWWTRMRAALAGWRAAVNSSVTQLHLTVEDLPEPLADFLRARLPEALAEAHEIVLREPELERSWIAFQQHVYRGIFDRLDRIENKLDLALGRAVQTPVWSIPAPQHHYRDRPDLIDEIERALKRGATALTALHGMGGIGKSQLALGFARRHRERYKAGVWIEAETNVSLLGSLAKLAPRMGIAVERDQEAAAMSVLDELSVRSPWLVIFDNADTPDALRPFVERLGSNGDVLITSRNENWDGLAELVSVTQWSVADSATFLLERTGQSDRDAAEALAGELDGLVLALDHAAAYMLAGDGMPIAQYRREWKEKLRSTPKGHGYRDSVAAALGLSLDAVARDCPPAWDLLRMFAWLAPDRIPRKELLEAGAGKLPESVADAFADRDRWTEVTDTLTRYSLLRRERTDGVVSGYYLHRIVQQVIRDRQTAENDAAKWFASACDVVSWAFPDEPEEPKSWAAGQALLPHARRLREYARDFPPPGSLSRLLNQAGVYLQARGLYSEARDFGEDSLDLALRQFGPDHSHVAVCRSNLANSFCDLGEHGEARDQIEQALESDLRQFGPDHPKVSIRRSNLAVILRNLGEPAKAREQMELALESDIRQFGPDHPTVAIRRSNLANVLTDLGEHAQAREQIELALESGLRHLGPNHPSIAIRRVNLAAILYQTRQPQAALREIDEALRIHRAALPPDHPDIRNAESSRAIILEAINPIH